MQMSSNKELRSLTLGSAHEKFDVREKFAIREKLTREEDGREISMLLCQ